MIAADTELAQRLQSDDPAAVRSLVDRYGSAVLVSALPAVGQEAVPDVVLDVFVVAAERPIRPGDDFAPWLAEIVAERAGAID